VSDPGSLTGPVQGTVQNETWVEVGEGTVDGSGVLRAPAAPPLPPSPGAQPAVVEADGDTE
jgi:hypothetical protein